MSAPSPAPSPLLVSGAVESAERPGVAWHYGDPLAEQRAAGRGGALVDGWLCGAVAVSGADRFRWLQALASADFAALEEHGSPEAGAGAGAQEPGGYDPAAAPEALWLTPQGHVQYWAGVYLQGDAVVLRTETTSAAADLAAFLESRRFRADIAIADISTEVAFVGVWDTAPATDAVPLFSPVPRTRYAAVAHSLIADGLRPIGTWAYDALRIAARLPRYGADNDARTLPHEIPHWLSRAVSLTKGCYCGQETVARIENIGAPPRRLVLLNLDGSGDVLPKTGDEVRDGEGRTVGRVGTVAQHWEDGPIALALVKRNVAPGVPLLAGAVAALIDPDDAVPAGPKRVYRKSDFVDLSALRRG